MRPPMTDHRQLHSHVSAYLQKGRPDKAIEVLIAGLRGQPDDLQLRSMLGDLYARVGKRHEAIECYRAVASAYATLGNLLPAIAAAQAILKVDPAHTGTQKLLAELYAKHSSTATPVKVSAPRTVAQAPRPPPGASPPMPPAPPYRLDFLETDEDEPIITGVEIPALPEVDSAELSVDPGALPRVPLFSELSRKAFVWLLPRLEAHAPAAGEVIAAEGDFGDSLFIVVNGTVRVEKKRKGEPPLVVNRLGPNTFFGEIALLGSGVRSASVVADTDAQLLELTRDTLHELLEEQPAVKQVMRRFYRERLFSDLLKTSPLFRALRADQVRDFAGRFKELEIDRGTRLQVEGKKPAGLHIILDGRCEVSRLVDGKRVVVSELGPGEAFGATSFLTGEPAATTVTARVRTTAVCVPHHTAKDLLARHPQVGEVLRLVKDGGEKVMDAAVAAKAKTGKAATVRQLAGDLAQVRPTSLLVFFEMERMTGVLRLDDGKTQAFLYLSNGRILDVEAPSHVDAPLAKLNEVLLWEKGSFDFSFQPVTREDRIQTGTTGLLLEAARVADEAAGGGGEPDLSSLDEL
jgi:cAMP-dependent protein kinase regulator